MQPLYTPDTLLSASANTPPPYPGLPGEVGGEWVRLGSVYSSI